MSSSERSIPHLRDIFGLSGSSGYTMHNNNQLHPTNNLSHYNHHNMNHHYQNGNSNVVNYGSSNSNDIDDHSSYGSSYDHLHNNNNNNNHHHPHQQQMIDSNALNNNNNSNNKKNSKKKRDNSKTLTSGDVKTLERHLSMKKTIRKKIMRDLQQAFVEDPNEFRIENINQEQLKAEIRAEALRFGATGDHQKPSRKSDNFLDMLRGEKNSSSSQQQQQSHQQQLLPQQHQNQSQQHYNSASLTNSSNNYNDYSNGSNREYDYDSQPTQSTEKQSFWRRFTMKNKTKR
ncbi:GATA zinc finger domain-containing protein 14-like [Condylostylus longicornis]|uniref:GATA zinc finger domain-containing protein 14-like n=1 Tax=Condylostylus longicornis TaxID=2530218 RepID=UPI00244DBC6F|nr:GATA zinc finger domain-containing protein 14-like [Condylostylus longicornis]XP_055385069.1 GATA zinc finger domain-containing protein 14-like [Condylostylus longicornis]XP_055385070.1 GATA zinc finger domain-containing protein 14-like [Condylostylus longicornis]XP_055385071.1 GATA zinc finger domain-containing protein 14-like [Condylostylus longicornis]XP_055385073.1 GATA zinc finger domain-containing protein 14-like [Condylostylus longicornis]XP_055385074.1 GATA zinc finger domain-contai